jgi:hypothetical protein
MAAREARAWPRRRRCAPVIPESETLDPVSFIPRPSPLWCCRRIFARRPYKKLTSPYRKLTHALPARALGWAQAMMAGLGDLAAGSFGRIVNIPCYRTQSWSMSSVR